MFIWQDVSYLDLSSHQTILETNVNEDDDVDSADDWSLHSVTSSQVNASFYSAPNVLA